MIHSLLLLLLLIGCATPKSQPQNSPNAATLLYWQGLEVWKSQDPKQALTANTLFKEACEKGQMAACLQVALRPPAMDLLPRTAILQGFTDSTSTQLNVLVPANGRWRFQLWELGTHRMFEPFSTEVAKHDGTDWVPMQLLYKGLKRGQQYRFEVFTDQGDLVDFRYLKTLTVYTKLRLAVASCMNDQYAAQGKNIWNELVSQKPELLLMIGDNVYATTAVKKGEPVDPNHLWRRYLETRQTLPIFKVENLIPTLAVWDDHDFGLNDGDGQRYPHVLESQKIFHAFYAQKALPQQVMAGPGVSSLVTIGDHQFAFLDDRSFRTPNRSPNGVVAHFGEDQEKWFFKNIGASKGPLWIISGNQFWGGYHPFESYEGSHASAFPNFVRRLQKVKRPFLFLSGDRHISEIIRLSPEILGFETFEITSSPMHAKIHENSIRKNHNPRAIAGIDGKFNFVLIDSTFTDKILRMDAIAIGETGENLFKKSLVIRR